MILDRMTIVCYIYESMQVILSIERHFKIHDGIVETCVEHFDFQMVRDQINRNEGNLYDHDSSYFAY